MAPSSTNSNNGEIRLATHSDEESIKAVVKAAYSHYVEKIGLTPAPMNDDYAALISSACVWCLHENNRVAGLIVLKINHDHVLICNVAVASEFQGKGYGRKLLDYADMLAREERKHELRLYTNELMHENLAIYSRLGWQEYQRTEEDGYRRVFMRKNLPFRHSTEAPSQ